MPSFTETCEAEAGSERNRPTIVAVSRTNVEGAAPSEETNIGDLSIAWAWQLNPVPKQVRTQVKPPTIVPLPTVPLGVHYFVKRAARIAGVQCVVVEEEDQGVIHITTFATPVSEEARQAIYELEANTIEKNPNDLFDFHVRRADEASGELVSPTPGQHFFAVWGDIGADASGSPSSR